MSTLISIISDQPIPNLLFIKQMQTPGMKYVMLSTDQMEQKKVSENIAIAGGIAEDDCVVYKISPADPGLIFTKLESISWSQDEKYIINITGGTKIMSQMVYQFFTSKQLDVEIYYTPISEPYWTMLYPKLKTVPVKKDYQLDLNEYFLAHGYKYSFLDGYRFPINVAKELMREVVQKRGAEKVERIKNAKSEKYFEEDKSYLTGEWFEEWCYHILKNKLVLPDGHIAMGIYIKNNLSEKKALNDNEIDVAFVYNNRLFLIECKVFNRMDGKKIAETVYKAASIRQTLGLQATSLVMLCTQMGKNADRKSFVNDICRLMNVKKVFSLEEIADLNKFTEQFKNLINYGQ